MSDTTRGCMKEPTDDCNQLNYFPDPQDNDACKKCNDVCATCEGSADNCTACADPYRTNYEAGRAKDSYVVPPTGLCEHCREGRTMATDGSCFYCEEVNEGCKTCDLDK
jgi:hypothetical protein